MDWLPYQVKYYELRERLKTLWFNFICSRPFLALHVLLGRPLMYKMPGTFYLREPLTITSNTKIVGCSFDYNTKEK